ncbi:hypothetical protein HDU97_003731 [Phlyctochytrium planicorne]|nr:hypothetical protein HDU97_003731 [Phlyctochytrium planicorne]
MFCNVLCYTIMRLVVAILIKRSNSENRKVGVGTTLEQQEIKSQELSPTPDANVEDVVDNSPASDSDEHGTSKSQFESKRDFGTKRNLAIVRKALLQQDHGNDIADDDMDRIATQAVIASTFISANRSREVKSEASTYLRSRQPTDKRIDVDEGSALPLFEDSGEKLVDVVGEENGSGDLRQQSVVVSLPPDSPPFVPTHPSIKYGFDRIHQIAAEFSSLFLATIIIVLLASSAIPNSTVWSYYFNTVDATNLLGVRLPCAICIYVMFAVVSMRIEAWLLGFRMQDCMREVMACGLPVVAYGSFSASAACILGPFLIAETGLFFGSPAFAPGRI